MGSGSSKSHESFAVAPSTAAHVTAGMSGDPAADIPVDAETPPEQELPPIGAINGADPSIATGVVSGVGADAGTERFTPPSATPNGVATDDAGTTASTGAAAPARDDTVANSTGDGSAEEPPPRPNDNQREVLTPIPAELPAGLAVGTPVLGGGGDLVDDTMRLIRYTDPAGNPAGNDAKDREALLCHLEPEAEGKLLAALATTAPTKNVEVEKEISGRLPVDSDTEIAERVMKSAKSVNHHLKDGTAIKDHTEATVAETTAQLKAIVADPAAALAEKDMAGHYLTHLEQIQQRIDTPIGERAPYTDPAAGKLAQVLPYETTTTITVTESVPDPTQIPLGQLPTTTRAATRIKAALDPASGQASWDGKARTKASGREYVVDLGDGYQAVYRPHLAIEDKPVAHSQRGSLEVLAPAGAGHGPELVDKLGTLNLGNRALTAGEGEWTYLRRQVVAQNLAGHPSVATALSEAPELDTTMQHVLMSQRANQAIGLDEAALHQFAAKIESDAAHAALPAKVRLLRHAVAHATGHADGAALAASPGYQPTPQVSGGWLTWSRFDVVDNAVSSALSGRRIHHSVRSGDSLVSMYRTGVLASTERRAEMGLPSGLGSSEGADKSSGGAQSVFCRITTGTGHGSVALIWDTPATLLRRADWYAYDGDHYGAIDPKAGHYAATALTRNPATVAGYGPCNEIMFRNGIDLLGPEGPDRVSCGSAARRDQILQILNEKGITHLKGVPAAKVITT